MKYFLIILFSLLTLLFSQQKKDLDAMDRETDQMEEDAYFFEENTQRINLNTATRENLKSLYLTSEQIEDIISYRKHSKNINSISELLNLSSITIVDIHSIRDFVTVEIPKTSTFELLLLLLALDGPR